MRLLCAALALAAFIAVGGQTAPAEAKSDTYFSFGLSGPGMSFYMGRYPRYGYPYYGYPYYGYRYDRRPYTRWYPSYRNYGARCDYWAGQCASNWGFGNKNFYGCLRYHGCR